MSKDGFQPKFCRGDHVYAKGNLCFNGRVLGYIQDLEGNWSVVVQGYETKFMVPENILQLVRNLPDLVPSKY